MNMSEFHRPICFVELDAAIKKGLEAFDTTSTDDALEEAKRELQDREQYVAQVSPVRFIY